MWNAIIGNLDVIKSAIGVLSVVMGAFLTAFKLGYRYLNVRKDKKIKKNKEYLDEYSQFLSEDDKKYIKKDISDMVMSNVSQEKSRSFRELKILLSKYDLMPDISIWLVLKRLKRYICIKNEVLSVNIDNSYYINSWFEKIFSITLILWVFIFVLAVFLSDGVVFETWKYYFLLAIVFVALVVSISLFINSPGKKKIKKIVKTINDMISEKITQ